MLAVPEFRAVFAAHLLSTLGIVICEIALSVLVGFMRGMIRETLTIVTWLGAAVVAFYAFPFARELARRGVEILIHPADAERMRTGLGTAIRRPSRGHLFAAMTPELAAFTPIVDGDVLPVLGGLEVIHTPGHTPGSVCLYGARDRVLFVGDALQRRRGHVSFASGLYSDDHAQAKRTVKRLATLDVEVLVFSHFPPLREGVAETLANLARQVID